MPDALKEGREALRLDALTPHLDKKLEPSVRVWLESRLPAWEKAVGEAETVGSKPTPPAGSETGKSSLPGTPPSAK